MSKNLIHENHANRIYKKRTTTIRIKKESAVVLLTKIHVPMEIKPTVKVMIGSVSRIL